MFSISQVSINKEELCTSLTKLPGGGTRIWSETVQGQTTQNDIGKGSLKWHGKRKTHIE